MSTKHAANHYKFVKQIRGTMKACLKLNSAYLMYSFWTLPRLWCTDAVNSKDRNETPLNLIAFACIHCEKTSLIIIYLLMQALYLLCWMTVITHGYGFGLRSLPDQTKPYLSFPPDQEDPFKDTSYTVILMESLKGIPPRNWVFVYLCKCICAKNYLDFLVSCGWPSAPNSEKFATGYKSHLDTQQGILKYKKN